MKIAKVLAGFIPLSSFIVFVVTDGWVSVTAGAVCALLTAGILIRAKIQRKETSSASFM